MAFLPISDEEEMETGSLINQIFTPELLKMLYYHALRTDIEDNNDKADLVSELLGYEFQELGTGTNRVAYLYTPNEERKFRGGAGLVFEIALDRRGFVDNFTEFKRSIEAPQYFVKAYECNMLVLVEEYVTLMDAREFTLNENGIKAILEDLSGQYLFEDIGFSLKNYENYGYRRDGSIVILDIGYIYNLKGNEHILSCPKCRARLKYNSTYTGFSCENGQCRGKYNFLDLRRRMNLELEDFENKMIADLNDTEMPDFDFLNEDIV